MEPSNIDQLINFIQGVGFPVFVAAYLLVVFRVTITDNTAAITALIDFLRGPTLPE